MIIASLFFWVFPPTGMLADKFNRYKLLLVLSVSLSMVFHTLLLNVDARVSPGFSPVRNVTEIPADLYCSRTGASLHLANESCPGVESGKWLAAWTPSECQPLACERDQHLRMRLCSPLNNCTQITSTSTSKLDVELVLESIAPVDGHREICKALVAEMTTDQTPFPGNMLCNCLIRCPVTLMRSPDVEDGQSFLNDSLDTSREEEERSNHNRAFWIYFILRIIATGSLATSFSMQVAIYYTCSRPYRLLEHDR